MTNPAWYPNDKDAKEILKFLLLYSRLEYALKCIPEYATGAAANFQKLKQYLKGKELPNGLSKSFEYLQKKPPRKQTSAKKWNTASFRDDKWDFIIECLTRVRNNLFHGGKHSSGPLMRAIRNKSLIRHCNLIMSELVSQLPDEVKEVFNNPQ